jgi:hypothetical protein
MATKATTTGYTSFEPFIVNVLAKYPCRTIRNLYTFAKKRDLKLVSTNKHWERKLRRDVFNLVQEGVVYHNTDGTYELA